MAPHDVVTDIDRMYEIARRHTHGRVRQEQLARITHAIHAREGNRQEGRIKAVLQSMLGPHAKRKTGYLLEQIKVGGDTIVDAGAVHGHVTDTFEDWMRTPESVNPDGIGAMDADPDSLMREPAEDFRRRYAKDNIPVDILDTVWLATRTRVAEENASLAETPSLQEFQDAISHLKRDSAPGISGLSYNMIKAWTDEVVGRVYNDIKAIWTRGDAPTDWGLCWLVPIPKKPDPSLNDLRPLCILEALRKAW
jgi:hypothetical protein